MLGRNKTVCFTIGVDLDGDGLLDAEGAERHPEEDLLHGVPGRVLQTEHAGVQRDPGGGSVVPLVDDGHGRRGVARRDWHHLLHVHVHLGLL